MADTLLRTESPVEFFKEQVEAACLRQRLHPQPLTSYYIVALLSQYAHPGGPSAGDVMSGSETLGLKLLRALDSGGSSQRLRLKQVGDASLVISGFFSDSLRRRLVDVDYYIAMGERAYSALADSERGPGLENPYGELSDRFGAFVDLFAEIAELSQLRSNRGLLRLYERFLLTRDERTARLLRDRGVALFAGPGAPPKRGLPQ